MRTSSRQASARFATQSAELAQAVPTVVAQRLMRMAMAGPSPSARDRQEFSRMGAEKAAAFWESWQGMWLQGLRMQQQWWLATMGLGARPTSQGFWQVMNAGLQPVHGRATSNARRLTRNSRR